MASVVRSLGQVPSILIVVGAIAIIAWYKAHRRAHRLAQLRSKYTDEDIVQRIMRHEVWQGQTTDQLRDSRGEPASVDGGLLKTRKREVWKYHRSGKNRYRLRITLDNDVVSDYFQKN